jgi:phosphate transport system ATP-binding protein
MTEPKIIVQNLSFSYRQKVILEDISLQLPENSIIAVTGPSGTGKSTFLTLLNRLWEENPDGAVLRGKVLLRFDNRLVDIYATGMARETLRRKVGMAFQTPNPLPMSIYRNIAFPLTLQGIKKNDAREQVEKMLRRVHLYEEVADRIDQSALQLSGGQQQRLCLGRALMSEPEILLLDEPTSSLDAQASVKIEQLLLELKKHCTIIIVSHYQDQVQRIADQIYQLSGRKLVQVT